MGDLVNFGDERIYEVKKVSGSSNYWRQLHEPLALRVMATVEQYRESSGTSQYPRT